MIYGGEKRKKIKCLRRQYKLLEEKVEGIWWRNFEGRFGDAENLRGNPLKKCWREQSGKGTTLEMW